MVSKHSFLLIKREWVFFNIFIKSSVSLKNGLKWHFDFKLIVLCF